jgi:hypothetical protein
MRIVGTNLPFKTADIRFRLRPDPENGGTMVAVSPEHELKYGPIGALMDTLMVRKTYLQGMEGAASGLEGVR